MAVLIDGRVQNKGKAQKNSGFYGKTSASTQPRNTAGFLNLQDPQDLAKLTVMAFLESPQYAANLLPVHANEAAAVTAGLETGTIYQTATGELRIKL